jgi:hypothetical protein
MCAPCLSSPARSVGCREAAEGGPREAPAGIVCLSSLCLRLHAPAADARRPGRMVLRAPGRKIP